VGLERGTSLLGFGKGSAICGAPWRFLTPCGGVRMLPKLDVTGSNPVARSV
jgi:hypothetical protein